MEYIIELPNHPGLKIRAIIDNDEESNKFYGEFKDQIKSKSQSKKQETENVCVVTICNNEGEETKNDTPANVLDWLKSKDIKTTHVASYRFVVVKSQIANIGGLDYTCKIPLEETMYPEKEGETIEIDMDYFIEYLYKFFETVN